MPDVQSYWTGVIRGASQTKNAPLINNMMRQNLPKSIPHQSSPRSTRTGLDAGIPGHQVTAAAELLKEESQIYED